MLSLSLTHDLPLALQGVSLDDDTLDEAVDRIVDAIDARHPFRVCFVNADCVNIAARHLGYRSALQRASVRWADGIGVRIGARLLGHELRDNVNGTDLFPALMDTLNERGARLFLLGGTPGVAEEVAEAVHRRWPGVEVVGTRDGFFGPEDVDGVIREIRETRADLMLTAMGAPRQELFNDVHHAALGVPVVLGVGGLFNFVSGRIPRAPVALRRLGLEWVHRLAMEPGRMWRRYLIGNLRFLAREALAAVSARLHAPHPVETDPVVVFPIAGARRSADVDVRRAA